MRLFLFSQASEMESSMPKKRGSRKKSPMTIELPQSILDHYLRTENIVRHTLYRKWLDYEFEYNAVENAFFKENNTFEIVLSSEFPQLKGRNLTRAEWNRIRRLIPAAKPKRFSSTFVQQQRIDFEKYRRCYNILKESKRSDQLMRFSAPKDLLKGQFASDEQFEIIRLIIEAKKLFALKSATIAELRDINSTRTEDQNTNDDVTNTNATNALIRIENFNEEITGSFTKLLRFQLVKDALLLDALSKKKIFLTLSPAFFRRKCELRIFENNRDFRSETFIDSHNVMILMNALLEITLSLVEHEQLATNAGDYIKTIVNQHLEALKLIMTPNDYEYLDIYIIPLVFVILQKINLEN